MKILVTGASGFIGKPLIRALKQQGDYVVGVGRQLASSNADNFLVIKDFALKDSFLPTIGEFEVVIHLAARVHVMDDAVDNPLDEYRKINVEGTLNLARQAATAGVKRFIFLSSIKVDGEHTEIGQPFIETDIPNPIDDYGISKLEAEQGLLSIAEQTDMEIVIIRPPLVYGKGVKANFASMLRMIKRGVPIPLGAIHNKRSFVYVDNLVSLIICCTHHPAAANQVFLVSDGHDLSTTELLRRTASALGVKSRLVPIPQVLIEFFAAIIGKKEVAQRLCGNLQVDITKARTLLDWMPPVKIGRAHV